MIFDKKEDWKKVKNFPYLISSYGRVTSLARKDSIGRQRKQIIKKPSISAGYFYMQFSKNAKPYTFTVHRLVALAFVPKRKGVNGINHIDGNKKNNHFKNLEWTTQKENVDHARKLGLSKNCTWYRVTDKARKEILEADTSRKIRQKLATKYKLHFETVAKIQREAANGLR